MAVIQPTQSANPALEALLRKHNARAALKTFPDKRRAIITTQGLQKTGKTHFYHTAPDPILILDIDRSTEGVTEKFPDKRIYTIPFSLPAADNFHITGENRGYLSDAAQQFAVQEMSRLHAIVKDFLSSNAVRTVVFDSGTDFYTLLRLARFGRMIEIPQQFHGTVKLEFTSLLTMAYDYNVNVIMTHKMGEKYKSGGAMELKGAKELVEYISQVHIEHRKDPGNGALSLTIKECRANKDVERMELRQNIQGGVVLEDIDFLRVVTTVFPETTEADWF